jgi:hypothetical protein
MMLGALGFAALLFTALALMPRKHIVRYSESEHGANRQRARREET